MHQILMFSRVRIVCMIVGLGSERLVDSAIFVDTSKLARNTQLEWRLLQEQERRWREAVRSRSEVKDRGGGD